MKKLTPIKASRRLNKLNYKAIKTLGDQLADLLDNIADTNIRDYLSEDELSQLAEASEILQDAARYISYDM